ncbi:unnamed protein product [Moneuplotes crassus]|uniref:DUF924 domain-containing protein n=1 Tax=Euplotes crassus TaxID=5936 RepID=A0AAD1XS97_EUPCR|nr:unnamed protein product [Moneuplotes crassus]
MDSEATIPEKIKGVLETWYKGYDRDSPGGKEEFDRWFNASSEYDQELTEKHQKDLEEVVADEGQSWSEHEDGRLAAIILIDQMSRNIYRGTSKAFENDHIGLKLAKEYVDSGDWENAKFLDKQFILLPFEHQEDVKVAQECVELGEKFQEMYKCRNCKWTDGNCITFVEYAKKHVDILEKFGRYPHRNKALCRECTEEEIEYLKTAETFNQNK